MLNEMEHMIRNLEDKELKSLVLQFLLRMQAVEEGKGYTEQQFYLDIKNTYYDLLAFKKREAHAQQHTQFHTTHLVFGDSPAGGLKHALKELALYHQEQIFTFSDLFSIGPIWHLHDAQGMTKRYEWLRTHLNIDDEVLFHYEDRFKQTLANIEQIPNHHSVIIWAGDNAHEQTGLSYVLCLLKEKANNIFIMNFSRLKSRVSKK